MAVGGKYHRLMAPFYLSDLSRGIIRVRAAFPSHAPFFSTLVWLGMEQRFENKIIYDHTVFIPYHEGNFNVSRYYFTWWGKY